jgi:hypothetical protein
MGRPVLRGSPGNPKYSSIAARDVDTLPGSEADRISAQSFGSFRGGDHAGNAGQKPATGAVKIVEMMIVAEQNHIHAA